MARLAYFARAELLQTSLGKVTWRFRGNDEIPSAVQVTPMRLASQHLLDSDVHVSDDPTGGGAGEIHQTLSGP